MERDPGGLPPAPALTPLGHVLGAAALVAAQVGLAWAVLALCGHGSASLLGLEAGLLLGLLCLVAELAIVDRAARNPVDAGVQSTLVTFIVRLAVVAPVTVWFGRDGVPADAQAFALSYCSTFFVYLCWLTWKTATAPVCYRGGRRAASPVTPAGPLARRISA